MKTIKLSENGVAHSPIVLTLERNHTIFSRNGHIFSMSNATEEPVIPYDGKIIKKLYKGVQLVRLACKTPEYLQNKGSITYAYSDEILLSEADIKDGEVTCKNCLKALGLSEKHMISDGYLYAIVCTFSKEYKTANGKLTPHLLDAKFYKKEANALIANKVLMYQALLTGETIPYSEFAKLSVEHKKLYVGIRVQNPKYEIVKIKLSVEGKI